MTFIGGLTAV